uniref:Homeodomain-like protein n=1 Tax=Mycena chlorophos TaxID=658473 RepID=A0ABQ0LR41_MYCCL|nr:predicted protein [Mycena chlorophos]
MKFSPVPGPDRATCSLNIEYSDSDSETSEEASEAATNASASLIPTKRVFNHLHPPALNTSDFRGFRLPAPRNDFESDENRPLISFRPVSFVADPGVAASDGLPSPSSARIEEVDEGRQHRALCRVLHRRGWIPNQISIRADISTGTVWRAIRNMTETSHISKKGVRVHRQHLNRDDETMDEQVVDKTQLQEMLDLECKVVGVLRPKLQDKREDDGESKPEANARRPATRLPKLRLSAAERALCRILHGEYQWTLNEISQFAFGRRAVGGSSTISLAVHNAPRRVNGRSGDAILVDDVSKDHEIVDKSRLARLTKTEVPAAIAAKKGRGTARVSIKSPSLRSQGRSSGIRVAPLRVPAGSRAAQGSGPLESPNSDVESEDELFPQAPTQPEPTTGTGSDMDLTSFLKTVKPNVDLSQYEGLFHRRNIYTVQKLREINEWGETAVKQALRAWFRDRDDDESEYVGFERMDDVQLEALRQAMRAI